MSVLTESPSRASQQPEEAGTEVTFIPRIPGDGGGGKRTRKNNRTTSSINNNALTALQLTGTFKLSVCPISKTRKAGAHLSQEAATHRRSKHNLVAVLLPGCDVVFAAHVHEEPGCWQLSQETTLSTRRLSSIKVPSHHSHHSHTPQQPASCEVARLALKMNSESCPMVLVSLVLLNGDHPCQVSARKASTLTLWGKGMTPFSTAF